LISVNARRRGQGVIGDREGLDTRATGVAGRQGGHCGVEQGTQGDNSAQSDQASRDKALRATVVKLAGKHHMVL
jgi:hypothetical protein